MADGDQGRRTLRIIGFTAMAAAMAACAPAGAADRGISYDCDTPAGHFSELVLPAPSGAFVVEGKVTLRQIAAIGDFLPGARLGVASAPSAAGKAPEEVAGFVLIAVPANKLKKGAGKELVQFIEWDRHGAGAEGEQTQDPFAITAAPQEHSFRLSYDGGAVTVTIGGAERRFPFQAREPVVRLVCSTGEFLYTDLRIVPQG
ncbi:hypothetical protein GON01_15305 [Sphingomonas sp. MAH-20]|uniref:Uncharacterized protein n=1 Tax=Sphingomonas horti TaxID=2682842 RepID=A0A6I4J3R7_9SPHN|nr:MULTISPECIES: hypothetical protein [Sphingomonas]MBA2919266.1 hypothetical protein [Sphingomonas sp. CGMCC 1.13658]MVO79299.1 hypothetical protein [Sphingomonas horti]